MNADYRLVLVSDTAAPATWDPEAVAAEWAEGAGVGLASVAHPAPDDLPTMAWDLTADADAAKALREALRAETPAGAAAALVPATLLHAPSVLIVSDVDSTLIEDEVIELLAAHAGREAEVAAVTEAAMRGELDFAESLHHRVKALKGLPLGVVEQVVAAVRPTAGARALVEAAAAHGGAVAAVSGGFEQVLDPVAASLGLRHARANRLGVEAGHLTGTVHGPVVDRVTKESCLRAWAGEAGLPLAATVGVGDGANDIDLVRAAGLGVAFDPKPALRAVADAVVGFRRLDVLAAFLGWGPDTRAADGRTERHA